MELFMLHPLILLDSSSMLMILFSLSFRILSTVRPENSTLWAQLGITSRADGRTTI